MVSTPPSIRVAAVVDFLCTSWSLAYVVWSASPKGHGWYGTLAKRWFEDYKGGVPILTLALPLLFMSSVCALLVVARPSTSAAVPSQHYNTSSNRHYVSRFWLLAIPCILGRRLAKALARISFDMLSFIFILVPCLVYFFSDIYRHLYGHDPSTSTMIKEVANAGGQVAMIALSFFLVPVSRHSVLLALMGWGQENAIRMHIWAGRICIIGVTFHGLGHMYRWYITNERVVYMLIPEAGCWNRHNEDYETITGTSCYDLFRNFTGFVALVAFLIIGFTSFNYIRRKSYAIFYTLHILAGPTALLFTILHWNRMLLFICPSILYYAASTLPVLMRLLRSHMNENGVKIISATDLSCPSSPGGGEMRSCVCITFEADDEAVRQFSPGEYAKVSVPSISRISHPFTVNRVLGAKRRHQMRIIFRVTGSFTKTLAGLLLNPRQLSASTGENNALAPLMLMDGFCGQKNLIDQVLGHDVAVIIAGGVGITPYLSLVSDLCSIRQSLVGSHGDMQQTQQEIHLHWICRDSTLIDFVTKEYFTSCQTNGFAAFRITIHWTGRDTAQGTDTAGMARRYSGTNNHNELELAGTRRIVRLGSGGLPFSPSRFSAGTTTSILGNLPVFLTFSTTAWLGLLAIWFMYDNFVSKKEIISRAYGVLALVPISLIVAIVANIVLDKIDSENALIRWNFGRKHAYTGLGNDNKEGPSDQYEDEQFTRGNSEAGLSLTHIAQIDKNGETVAAKSENMRRDVSDLETIVPSSRGVDQGNKDGEALCIEHASGRPSMVSILSCLDSAHNPGVFVCGPSAMVKHVKYAARLRYSMRLQQCLTVASPDIHKESFEL